MSIILSRNTYAWCFGHGGVHLFLAGEKPSCTNIWVPFIAYTEEEAIQAKRAAYGNAQFFDELPLEKKLKVISIAESWL